MASSRRTRRSPRTRGPRRRGPGIGALVAIVLLAGILAVPVGSAAANVEAAGAAVPRYDHVVVLIMENHSADNVIGNPDAPYINTLANQGASMTQSYGVTHPSQPNYIALYSGSTQGIVDDSCPHTFDGNNLGAQLIAAGQTFVGYSESMPSVGYIGCQVSNLYARKHNPWVDFSNINATANQPLTSLPVNWAALPTVSMVVPNLQNDMHDGTIAQGDTWVRDHFDGYVQWAKLHNSLLVLTWDEDDYHASNRIPTVFAGAGLRTGQYAEHINHYNVLRTLQDMFGLAPLGYSATAAPIVDIWASSPVNQPFAADAFARTRLTGWGSADVGGPWTVSPSANSSVGGGTGSLLVGLRGTTTAMLPVSSSDSDTQVTMSMDKVATGNGTYVRIIGRHTATNVEYQAQLRSRPDGKVLLSLQSTTPATTALTAEFAVPNVSIAGSAAMKVRFQVTGTSPTVLRARAWPATGAEPATWLVSATDSAAPLQTAGSIGLYTYLSGLSTVSPVTVRFGAFSARPTG